MIATVQKVPTCQTRREYELLLERQDVGTNNEELRGSIMILLFSCIHFYVKQFVFLCLLLKKKW